MLCFKINSLSHRLHFIIFIFVFIRLTKVFQFIPPTISVSPLTINTLSSYTFSANRQYDAFLQATPWNSSLVPAGSNIIIVFPSQYDIITNSPNCQLLMINGGVSMDPYTCSVSNQSLIISGAVPSNIAISQVSIFTNNVMNPSPALTTGSFIVKIGNDNSQNLTGQATVTLQPGTLSSCFITFSPAIVNTTGKMIVSITPKHIVPSTGSLRIKFAASLQWQKDLSTNNQLPISGSLPCVGISTNTNNATISCIGLVSTQQITISNLLLSNTTSQISISIDGLFSPPTTQSIDAIKLSSYLGNYAIDQCNSVISGLQPKTMSVSISSTSAVMPVNSAGGLKFDFTLSDTISKDDYFQIQFPLGSKISFITAISNFILSGNYTYNSSTRIIKIYQAINNPITYAGKACYVTFLSYTAPSSIRPTNPIIFRIKNGDYQKMQGSNTIAAVYKNYTVTGTTTYDTVSTTTNYNLIIPLADPLTSTAMFIIKVPVQLTLSTQCPIFTPSGTITANPPCSISGQAITINNIASGATFPAQNISINILSVKNPSSAKKLSDWQIQIYYTNDPIDLVAIGTKIGIQILPGLLSSSGIIVTPNNLITLSSNVSYIIQITSNHSISSSGYVKIVFPNETILSNPTTCQFEYLSGAQATSCTYTSSSTIQIFLIDAIPSSTKFKVYINGAVTNPPTTKPTSSFQFITMNSQKQQIDTISQNIFATASTPRPFIKLSVTPSSLKNYDITSYSFNFSQLAPYTNNSLIRITFPNQISFQSNSSCSNGNSNILICTKNTTNNFIEITLPFPNTTSQITIIINGVINGQSFKQSSSFLFQTYTNQSFFYSNSTNNVPVTVKNNISSLFVSVSYNFGQKQFASTNSNLTLSIQMKNSLPINGKVTINLDWLIINSPGIQCITADFTPTCNTVNTSIIQISSTVQVIPALFSITLRVLTNPSTMPSNNLTLRSYDPSNFLIHQQSTIKFQLQCELPCQTCPGTNTSKCLSCYSLTSNITTFIYLFNFQCLQNCPYGTFDQNYSCLSCDLNCKQCSILSTNCTSCQNSSYLLLSTTSNTKSCVTTCPSGMYQDTTVSPNQCSLCVNPCVTCVSSTQCLQCIDPLYLIEINKTCVTTCPINIYVPNDGNPIKKCLACDTNCKTCQNLTTTCTSCNNPLLLYLNKCIATCPAGFVPNDPILANATLCISCLSPCQQCFSIPTNCTKCLSAFPYLYQQTCLTVCPQLTFNNTSTSCQLCSSITPSINCQNCSSSTVCLTCDLGFVYFASNKSCLATVPIGYVNISGIAQPCLGDCKTCQITQTNCTSCKTLFLQVNSCINPCPNGKVGINNICQLCSSPCSKCQTSKTNCTACVTNYYFISLNNTCTLQCPVQTFPSNSTLNCQSCTAPCYNCTSTTQCINCQTGYLQGTLCLLVCPTGKVGVGSNSNYTAICQTCQAPCLQCTGAIDNCSSCIAPQYFYDVNQSCINQCPAQITIPNIINRTCSGCVSPCLTCIVSVNNCLTCIPGKLLNGNNCVDTCPEGKYASNSTCQDCSTVNTCLTCSSPTICTSCSYPFLYYQGNCTITCPPAFNVILNNSCTPCLQNCINCSNSNQCFNCSLNHILFNNTCITQCPVDYTLTLNQTIKQYYCNYTGKGLTQSLTLVSVFPLPFTIIGILAFIACFMSKLQNQNTYLMGLAYCIFGFFEVGSIVYLGYQYWENTINTSDYQESIFIMIAAGLGLIYLLNILGLCLQTPLLLWDIYFRNWLHAKNVVANQDGSESDLKNSLSNKSEKNDQNKKQGDQSDCCGHRCSFTVITIISLLFSYKFKIFIFTRLFSFDCLSARLQNVQQFRLFNLLSFLGILHQGQILYVSFVLIGKFSYDTHASIFMAAVDVIIIALLNILLALIASHKNDDFFQIKDTFNKNNDKIKKNKKEDDNKLLKNKYTPMDSTSKLKHDNQDQDQQISLQLSKGDDQLDYNINHNTPKNKKKLVSNIFQQNQDDIQYQNQDFMRSSNKLKKSTHVSWEKQISPNTKSHVVNSPNKDIIKVKKSTLSPKSKSNLSPQSPRKSKILTKQQRQKNKLKNLQDLSLDQIKTSSLKTRKINNLQFQSNIKNDVDMSQKTSPKKKQWIQVNQVRNKNNNRQQNSQNINKKNDNKTIKGNNINNGISYIKQLKDQQQIRSNIKNERKLYGKKSQFNPNIQNKNHIDNQQQQQDRFEELPVQLRDLDYYQVNNQALKPIELQNFEQQLQEQIKQNNQNINHNNKILYNIKQNPNINKDLQIKQSYNQLNQGKYSSKNNNDKSYQSILPFVHQNGQLIQKPDFNKNQQQSYEEQINMIRNKKNKPQMVNISLQHNGQQQQSKQIQIQIQKSKQIQTQKQQKYNNFLIQKQNNNFIQQKHQNKDEKQKQMIVQQKSSLHYQFSKQLSKSNKINQQNQSNLILNQKSQNFQQNRNQQSQPFYQQKQFKSKIDHDNSINSKDKSPFSKSKSHKQPKIYNSGLKIAKIQHLNNNDISQNIKGMINQKQEMLKKLQYKIKSKQEQLNKNLRRQRSRQFLAKSKQKQKQFDPLNRNSLQKNQKNQKYQKQVVKIRYQQQSQQNLDPQQSQNQIKKNIKVDGNIFSHSQQQSVFKNGNKNKKLTQNNILKDGVTQQSIDQDDKSQKNKKMIKMKQNEYSHTQYQDQDKQLDDNLQYKQSNKQQKSNIKYVRQQQHSQSQFKSQSKQQSKQQQQQQQQQDEQLQQSQSQQSQKQNEQDQSQKNEQQSSQQQNNNSQPYQPTQSNISINNDYKNQRSNNQSKQKSIQQSQYTQSQHTQQLHRKSYDNTSSNQLSSQNLKKQQPIFNFSKQKLQQIQSQSNISSQQILNNQSNQIYNKKNLLKQQNPVQINRNQQFLIKEKQYHNKFQFPKQPQQQEQHSNYQTFFQKRNQNNQLTYQQQLSIQQLLKNNQQKFNNKNISLNSNNSYNPLFIAPLKTTQRKQLPRQQQDDFGISRIKTNQYQNHNNLAYQHPIPPVHSFKKHANPLQIKQKQDNNQIKKRNMSLHHPIYAGKINKQFIQASNSQKSFPDSHQQLNNRRQKIFNKSQKNHFLQGLQKRDLSSRDEIPRHHLSNNPFNPHASQQLSSKPSETQIVNNWGRHFRNQASKRNFQQDDSPNKPIINEDSYLPQLQAHHQSNDPFVRKKSHSRHRKNSHSNSKSHKRDQGLQKIYLQKLQFKKK